MNFFNIFEHLLPKARAWKLTIQKTLKDFIEGLSEMPSDVKNYYDLIFFDMFPSTTRQLEQWEDQFGIIDTGLNEANRRLRLLQRWQDLGGQSPRYIQDTLQAHGFDVYVHEWWVSGTEPDVNVKLCVTPRSPFDVLSDSTLVYQSECGETLSECGESTAECGETLQKTGYVLVNKIFESSLANMSCGESLAECGESLAECGEFLGFTQSLKQYTIPSDSDKWPYFLYIGGQTFGDNATISNQQRDEFERLCLKICPCQQWLGIMVQYT